MKETVIATENIFSPVFEIIEWQTFVWNMPFIRNSVLSRMPEYFYVKYRVLFDKFIRETATECNNKENI